MKNFSILTVFVCFIIALPAHAQTGEWVKGDYLNARLIAAGNNEAALQIDLKEGWHTYWRIPGDAGLPPMFSWAESKNIEDVEIKYPAPKRKKEMHFITFGYDDEMTLPFSFTRKDADKKTKLDLNAQIMVCKDICIPERFELELPLKEQDATTKEAAIIAAAKQSIPQYESVDGLSIDSIVIAKDSMVVSITSNEGFEGMDVFPVIEDDYLGLTVTPELTISEHDPQKAMLRVGKGAEFENLAAAVQGKTLSITLVHGDKVVEKSVQY